MKNINFIVLSWIWIGCTSIYSVDILFVWIWIIFVHFDRMRKKVWMDVVNEDYRDMCYKRLIFLTNFIYDTVLH